MKFIACTLFMLKNVDILIVMTYPSIYYSVTHNIASHNCIYCGTLYLRTLFYISFLNMSEIHKFLLLEITSNKEHFCEINVSSWLRSVFGYTFSIIILDSKPSTKDEYESELSNAHCFPSN
jgi:hypothetical protein